MAARPRAIGNGDPLCTPRPAGRSDLLVLVQADQRLELLRTFYDRWSAGDYVEAATLLFDPEVELVQPPELPGGGGTYHGYEGLQARAR